MKRHRLIRASAGTGKTHQLALRYLELLLAGARPTEILASTFTVRAAAEIRDRVLRWLATSAIDPERRRALNAQLSTGLDERSSLTLLQACTRQIHRLQISTLDSFFHDIARHFQLELDLPGGWRIGEEHELGELRAAAIARLLDRDPRSVVQWVRILDPGDSPRSVWRQLDDATKDLHRLYLESDVAAWRDDFAAPGAPDFEALAQQLEAAGDGMGKRIANCTLEDAGRLRAEPPRLDELSSKGIAKAVAEGKDSYYGQPIPEALQAIYRGILEYCAALWRQERARRTRSLHELLEAYDAEFQAIKLARATLEFEDLPRLLALSHWLERMDEIWVRLDARVNHLLLDEFQDTNRLQWAVLDLLAREALTRDDKSLFAVGDLKQAIYRWRGAEPAIFRSLLLQAERDGASVERLDRSYRSAPEILDAVDRVFANLPQLEAMQNAREAASAWCEDYTRPDTARTELAGQVWMHAVATEKRSDAPALARGTLDQVQRMLDEGAPEIALLVRSSKMLAQLRHECLQRGLFVSEEGGTRLDQLPAPQLLLSLLRLAEHPGDPVARFHLLHSPLAEVLALADDERSAQRAAHELRLQLQHEGVGWTLWHYGRRIRDSLGMRSLRRIEQLVQLGHAFDALPGARPGDFLRYIESKRVEDPQSARVRLLTIHGAKGLQFHSVVLCELDRALVGQTPMVTVARENPMLPPTRVRRFADQKVRRLDAEAEQDYQQWRREQLMEELSLFYVAMTRAEQQLHFVCGQKPASESCSGILHEIFGAPEPGESRQLEGSPRARVETSRSEETRPERLHPALAPASGQRGQSAVSPSRHDPGESAIASAQLAPRNRSALQRGRALHAALACIGWSEDELPPAEDWLRRMRAVEPELGADSLAQGLAEFRRLWPRLQPALARAGYPQDAELLLWRERAFALRDGGRVQRGRYDRVVLGRRDGRFEFAHILDFKSDAPETGGPATLAGRYRAQMESYARAIQHRCRLPRERIRLSLLWTESDELVDLDP